MQNCIGLVKFILNESCGVSVKPKVQEYLCING